MASAVNRGSRKRKSTSDLIFEVDEGDFSPSLTPEPNEDTICEINKETNDCQTLNDLSKIFNETSTKLNENENILEQNKNVFCDNLVKQMSSIGSKDSKMDNTSPPEFTVISNKHIIEEDMKKEDLTSTSEIVKPDVDLRCMDMEVANSPPPISSEKPFISVIFRDKDAAEHIGVKMMNYIKSVVEYEFKLKISTSQADCNIDFWEDNTDSLRFCDTPEYLNYTEPETKPDSLDLFVVDTKPSQKPEFLPRYTPNNRCKTIGEPEQIASFETPSRSTHVCFNCEGNHAMKDCTEIRNARRIAIARNKFRSQHKNVRYHVDNDTKYAHLVPGKISIELRRALDVRKHELPQYIYRMRTLGYPPGWLEEAMTCNSKLELFDFEGCAVNEIQESSSVIDSSKIIEFAGFNTPPEKGFRDEYKYFNSPPYSEKHSKECMIEYIQRMSRSEQEIQPESKELKSDDNGQENQSTDKIRRSESPSLNDLELRKKQLLAELDDGSLNSPQTTDDKQMNPLSKDLIESPVVVSSSFGTPIIKTESSFVQLPERDKFSKDICPVINFENLPDSTGKYEQMTVVINKVRQTVKNIKS